MGAGGSTKQPNGSWSWGTKTRRNSRQANAPAMGGVDRERGGGGGGGSRETTAEESRKGV